MAMRVTKKCPHCKGVYEQGPDQRGIGTPLRSCESCGNTFVDTDENEWELMGPLGKLSFVFISTWTAFVFGIALPALCYAVDKDLAEDHFLGLYACGVVAFALILGVMNTRDIKESRHRMRDPDYRSRLHQAGLLRE